ncbi:MAG: baseplate J/gp47 family protein [Anaerolineae bacterium]
MNGATLNLIERPYAEVVDDILTAIVGGVVNEPIFFDVKEDRYPLAKPASGVRSITGARTPPGASDAQHVAFQNGQDFDFDGASNSVTWRKNGARPDDETTFYVDYFLRDASPPLTDINVGSVTRTLSEAISVEIATVYQQINQAYLAGFIDTASGKSLDLVVSILGVTRKTPEYAQGVETFYRDAAVQGAVTIAEGLGLSTDKGVTFVTAELRTLQRGQVRIDVPIRATDASKGPAGQVGPNTITTLAQPLAGIGRVTNLEATQLGAEAETDEQLRARARAVLRGLGKATLAALVQALFDARANLLEVWDPNGGPGKTPPAPGMVTLLIDTPPERFADAQSRVEETRAAGVLATLVAKYIFFRPRLVIRAARSDLTPDGKLKLIGQVIEALSGVADKLTAGQPALGKDLLDAVKKVDDVAKDGANAPRFVDVMAWQSDIGQPAAATLVNSLVDAVSATPGDPNSLRAAFTRILSDSGPVAPTSSRLPARNLVQMAAPGRSGGATDEDIAAGQFQVTTPDPTWTVVLDMDPSDVFIAERR